MTSRRTAVLAALSISACVAAPMSGTSLIIPAVAQSDDYQLSAAEQKLSCKQLSGRIQVRIMQIRDYGEHGGSSQLARGLQSAFSKTVGTSAKGVDPDGTHSQDLKISRPTISNSLQKAAKVTISIRNCRNGIRATCLPRRYRLQKSRNNSAETAATGEMQQRRGSLV